MSGLNIPDKAMDVAWRAFAAHEDDYVAALADAITAATPLIVATELRRIAEIADHYANNADKLAGKAADALSPSGYAGKAVAHERQAWCLRQRANELDPPGGAS